MVNPITMLARYLLILFSLLTSIVVGAQAAEPPKRFGMVVESEYDAAGQKISLRGWVVTGVNGTDLPTMDMSIRGESFTGADVRWSERADLTPENPATGGQYGAGFSWDVKLSKAPSPGIHSFRVSATYPDGAKLSLASPDAGAPFVVVQTIRERHWWILAVVVIAAGVITYLGRKRTNRGGRTTSKWTVGCAPFVWIGGLFALLVAFGVTGSSLGWLLQGPFGQSMLDVKGNTKSVVFSPRAIRGDEWGVLMPNVLAQIHHDPQFPIVNSNIGLGGQNMGVIGMTGAPVKQWAALARPATWGYFLLPLRQAMSWQWQLPFWGGLLAVWCLLNVLRPSQRGLNFGLSFAFCVAPYAAAWSNWPLYAIMFPAFAFVVLTGLVKCTSVGKALIMGLILGWLLACWFLVLYPAWLIVVGSLLVFVGIGWAIENRSQLRFGAAQFMGVVVALAVLGALLGSWWLDTRDAVAIMQATEYPGRRGSLPGGDMSWWWSLRGYNNAEVVLRLPGPVTNESEASSYFILPFALATICLVHLLRRHSRRWIVLASAAFIACYCIYVFVGFPIWLAKLTLWGNMPTGRMEVGLGLAITVIFALVAGFAGEAGALLSKSRGTLVFPMVMTIASGILIAAALTHTPLMIMPGGSVVFTAAMVIGGVATCWWLLRNRMREAISMLIVMHLLTSLAFNPIGRAPRDISLADGNRPFVIDASNPSRARRTVVMNGDGIGPLTLAAAGVPISNGVLYYPHKVFWEKMGLLASEWPEVNRYQHLGFYLDSGVTEARGYIVGATSVDQVHVHVNPQSFDFSKTGAERVAVLADSEQLLRSNPSLTWLGEFRNLHWFAVKPSKNSQ
ncbi:DUF7657 domain-containing protein [Diaphorobacter caeni]|uniref:DUF7657 domain-containing protein n=1 Tax=Diaphorobacter caeni TaxID=2784387 RepID=UPI0018904CF5|nr:hypothetical protein [Diaphorobacter caeni]MBF5003975.1 hypothetical protein [Diaphorobacter caeni]